MSRQAEIFDTVIIGAGAAGMMCAAHAGGRVLVLDHAKAPGEKIRISGGGRCNFTNLHAGPENFLSANPHFAKSALSRYTQYDFIELVDRHRIPWHEKTLGQLFCDGSSKEIIALLLAEMSAAGAELRLHETVHGVERSPDGFALALASGPVQARNLVVACGGKSIPKMGATGFGYRLAEQFGLAVTETRPALVPFTFDHAMQERMRPLAGVAVPARAACNGAAFDEAMLITHRGISGPAILQISSFWREGEEVTLTLLPETDLLEALKARRQSDGRKQIATVLGDLLPKRLADDLAEANALSGRIGDQSDIQLAAIAEVLTRWVIRPMGTEGYRTAEVTLGGVDTAGLDSRSMEAKAVPGLYFIGEVVDVTGWLGGYNFQWAWSSGWAAGTAIAAG
ncbi:NAD(P)/FAD-dependent oxidoreductase [Rhodobacteraceae bacterium NNCM2]|nr:NAD(P)/FAD-dependent oxidoreductase [Coraliihabitans acroporae]